MTVARDVQNLPVLQPFLRPIPLTNFTMKRGAERQLTKDEFEEGNVEPEARLPDPDDTHTVYSPPI